MTVIEVVEPAASRLLGSIDDIRALSGVDAATVDDALLTLWLNQIAAAVDLELDRVLAVERVIERIERPGWRMLGLDRTPVREVFSVSIDGVALEAGGWTLLDPMRGSLQITSPYTFGLAGPGWWAEPRGIGGFPPAPNTYLIEYTGGYIMPPDPAADLPPIFTGVAADAVRQLAAAQAAPSGGGGASTGQVIESFSETLGDFSQTTRYSVDASATVAAAVTRKLMVTPAAQASLRPYRRVLG